MGAVKMTASKATPPDTMKPHRVHSLDTFVSKIVVRT